MAPPLRQGSGSAAAGHSGRGPGGLRGGGDFIDDPDAVTFACEGYAIYKCISVGYAPWVTFDGHQLADYHQACTRMIRADYCGDGRSWTKDGVWINLYDELSIQNDDE